MMWVSESLLGSVVVLTGEWNSSLYLNYWPLDAFMRNHIHTIAKKFRMQLTSIIDQIYPTCVFSDKNLHSNSKTATSATQSSVKTMYFPELHRQYQGISGLWSRDMKNHPLHGCHFYGAGQLAFRWIRYKNHIHRSCILSFIMNTNLSIASSQNGFGRLVLSNAACIPSANVWFQCSA